MKCRDCPSNFLNRTEDHTAENFYTHTWMAFLQYLQSSTLIFSKWYCMTFHFTALPFLFLPHVVIAHSLYPVINLTWTTGHTHSLLTLPKEDSDQKQEPCWPMGGCVWWVQGVGLDTGQHVGAITGVYRKFLPLQKIYHVAHLWVRTKFRQCDILLKREPRQSTGENRKDCHLQDTQLSLGHQLQVCTT